MLTCSGQVQELPRSALRLGRGVPEGERGQAGGHGITVAVTTTTGEGYSGAPSTQRSIFGGPGDRGLVGRGGDGGRVRAYVGGG